MTRSRSLRYTLSSVFVVLAVVAICRMAIFTPEPIRAEERKTAQQQQILLHMLVVSVDSLKAKNSNLNLADMFKAHSEKSPGNPHVVVSLHEGKRSTLTTLLTDFFDGKILAEPTLVTKPGRVAKFLSGGEVPVVTLRKRANGEVNGHTEYKPIGLTVDVVPKTEPNGTVRLQIEAVYSKLLKTKDEGAANPTIQSRKFTANALMKPGHTLILLENPSQVAENEKTKDKLFVAITPEFVAPLDEEVVHLWPIRYSYTRSTPSQLSPSTRPRSSKPASKTFRVEKLKETLELFQGAVCFVESDKKITRALNGAVDVVDLEPTTPYQIKVEATKTGTTTVFLWDENDNVSQFEVAVIADTRQLVRKLVQLFPGLSIQVHDVNGALLLRGTVRKAEQIAQITEIAEQYAPSIINHLVVESPQTKMSDQAKQLAVELSQLKRTLGPKHPSIVQREQKLEALQQLEKQDNRSKIPDLKEDRAVPNARNDRQRMLNEIRLLRQDVKRLIEILEDKLDKDATSRAEPATGSATPIEGVTRSNAKSDIGQRVPGVERSEPPAIEHLRVTSEIPPELVATKLLPELWNLSLSNALALALKSHSSSPASTSDLAKNSYPSSNESQSGDNRIVIARISIDVPLADFEIQVSNTVSDVESKYWSLWSKHQELSSIKTARELLIKTWYIETLTSSKDATVQTIRQECSRLKQAYDVTLKELYADELALRSALGISAQDGRLIRPTDTPKAGKFDFEWDKLLTEMLESHPKLRQIKWRIKQLELQLEAAKIKSNADFSSEYSSNQPAPVGQRSNLAVVRNLELKLARERAILKEAVLEAKDHCVSAIRDVDSACAQLIINRRQRDERNQTLTEAKSRSIESGVDRTAIVKAIANWLEAEANYLQAIAHCLSVTKDVHLAKGSLLRYRRIVVDDDKNARTPETSDTSNDSTPPD